MQGKGFLQISGTFLLLGSLCLAHSAEGHAAVQAVLLASDNERQFTKEGELSFFGKTGEKRITIDIEMPDTREERARGLMYRRSMAETGGMLFVHGPRRGVFFWMKNTYIPLDMIFADKEMKIIQIRRNTTPLSEEPIFLPAGTEYTIEVNAGFSDRHGIQPGDSIQVKKTHSGE